MHRRKLVLTVSSLAAVGVAGCTETDSQGSAGDDGTGDGTGDGGSSGDGGDGGTDDTTTSNGSGPAVDYEESFVMEVTSENPQTGEDSTTVMRVNGQNSHMTIEGQQEIEVFIVDGDFYQVVSGQCLKNPGNTDVPVSGPVPEPGEDWDPTADLDGEPDRRESIDGEEMLVYTYNPSTDTVYDGAEVTAYVSAETGYLRRVESEGWRVEYHSWGEVDPIEAPEMNCQSVGGGSDDY